MTTQNLIVQVHRHPEPGLLRPAILAALTGSFWPEGPEATIARAVVEAAQSLTAAGLATTSPADAILAPEGEQPC